MKQGTVLWFNDDKGYGFLRPDGETKDLFVHYTAINGQGPQDAAEGSARRVRSGRHREGPAAANVTVIG
jgi:CspA family cold shock protein